MLRRWLLLAVLSSFFLTPDFGSRTAQEDGEGIAHLPNREIPRTIRYFGYLLIHTYIHEHDGMGMLIEELVAHLKHAACAPLLVPLAKDRDWLTPRDKAESGRWLYSSHL